MPRGVILHGSRSGNPQFTTAQEFNNTSAWAANPSNVLGWNAGIGDDCYDVHLDAAHWGWNAYEASKVYLAVEFAQPVESRPISDAQVNAFCHWYATVARKQWPTLPLHMPTHSQVEASGEIMHAPSGKTDVFSLNSPNADELRSRILKRLKEVYGIS